MTVVVPSVRFTTRVFATGFVGAGFVTAGFVAAGLVAACFVAAGFDAEVAFGAGFAGAFGADVAAGRFGAGFAVTADAAAAGAFTAGADGAGPVATALAVCVVSTGTAGAFAELAFAFAADFGVFAGAFAFGFEVATFDGFADADAAALAFAACDSAAKDAVATRARYLRGRRPLDPARGTPRPADEGNPMARLVRAVFAATVTAAVIGALAGCNFFGPVERVSDQTTITEDIATVQLEDPTGSVTVRGGATEVVVKRTLSYRGELEVEETHRVDGDTLELRGCGRRCVVDYTIEVPSGVDVRGSTSNGAIDLEDVAEVDVQTSNGRIELEDVTGSVVAETSNGRISGSDLTGDGVRATSSNGAIELELGTPQDVEASTSNGSIRITVPADSYRVSTETSNGRTDVGIPNDSDGRFSLDLRTSNGSITVEED